MAQNSILRCVSKAFLYKVVVCEDSLKFYAVKIFKLNSNQIIKLPFI